GRSDQRALLGGKGANLAEMTSLGIPVPPGFTLTTEVCSYFYENGGAFPEALAGQIDTALERVGDLTEGAFGDRERPLLLSVRSGSAVSMPGMMDTVLNLGLNDETVKGLADGTGDPRFAYDCYRRFVATYGRVVMGVEPATEADEDPFSRILDDIRSERGVSSDGELTADDLKSVVTAYKIEILKQTDTQFPEDPAAQLWGAISAVLRSWHNPRADVYRRMQGISDSHGTAVSVQAMVFGNMGKDSGTGVAFTRNPSTGEPGLFGEFLLDAQGEDVVAGIRTPQPIAEIDRTMPSVYEELDSVAKRLERHFKDCQDLEFTIQNGRLWLLQTRTGKRTGRAMVRMAVDLVEEGLIDEREAVMRVDPLKLEEILHPTIDPDSRPDPVAKGLPASPGAAIGRVVFTAGDAEAWHARGEEVILVRVETSPEDIAGMKAANAIVTARGGMTSHAAVVARGIGRCCVTGASGLGVDLVRERVTIGELVIKKGDTITVDGSTGEIFLGRAALIPAVLDEQFETLMSWVDELRRLRVRTNADTPADARTARAFGAEGIGLCRTEHMFFGPERISAIRQMILADSADGRRTALEKILPMQREDFIAIFEAMSGLPVTVRLLDPPLHEFLPSSSQEIADVARELGTKPGVLTRAIAELREENPMLGHRGCRLGVSYPEVYETQARAIAEAAVQAAAEGNDVQLEIMIPFVSVSAELELLRGRVEAVVEGVFS
ncbi:MAG: pyruvate, phosphate dikinase, partial [Deltaproteobacteria bacterium]|nr:pyruvate, phosphate dikinase [Deltaproteobacteria bacterium]